MSLTPLLKLRWTLVYVLLIPLVNWSFAHVPTVPMPDGGAWSPMAIVTGLILVVRDFAQREVNHYVLLPLLFGLFISYFMAPPEVALASGMAFAISEMVDYIVYTTSKKPLSQRVMLSSTISAPLDSTVFWAVASMSVVGVFTLSTVLTSIISKLLGAYVVYLLLKRSEQKKALVENTFKRTPA